MDNNRLFFIFGHRPFMVYSALVFSLLGLLIMVEMPRMCMVIIAWLMALSQGLCVKESIFAEMKYDEIMEVPPQ